MPGNHIYRFYSDVPDVVFDWLKTHASTGTVRSDGKGIGTSGWFHMTIVLDDTITAERFERWLDTRGKAGCLAFPSYRSDPSSIMRIENTRWITRADG